MAMTERIILKLEIVEHAEDYGKRYDIRSSIRGRTSNEDTALIHLLLSELVESLGKNMSVVHSWDLEIEPPAAPRPDPDPELVADLADGDEADEILARLVQPQAAEPEPEDWRQRRGLA